MFSLSTVEFCTNVVPKLECWFRKNLRTLERWGLCSSSVTKPDSLPLSPWVETTLLNMPVIPREATPMVLLSTLPCIRRARLLLPPGSLSPQKFQHLTANTFNAGQHTTNTPTL